ncbi:MAG: glycoside hydrolase family 2 TIM barrel-domain containing protein [Pseudomonadota bacterium]
MNRTHYFFLTCLIIGISLSPTPGLSEAIPVEIRQEDDGWTLYRGGEPYFIRGAGGTASLEKLAAAGANSVRTWDTKNIDTLLDEAHALGLSVTAGIWLGHERHGFDYNDQTQVDQQLRRARQAVLRYKDHPALLLWGIGNETEGFAEGDNRKIWSAINDVAAMVKELDPNHPTMAVTTFVHGKRIEYLHNKSPAIDIHGVNAYGGALVLPERLRAGGATKPFVLTEFGPVGPWEMPKTDWGAPLEQTSTDKAAFYRRVYGTAIAGEPGRALGSYAFLWGHKMEATSTWFGMFLADGASTAAVDVMSELWSEKKPDNLAPKVEPLVMDGATKLDPNATIDVAAAVEDPDQDALRAVWVLRPESGDYATGGDFRPNLPDIKDAIIEGDLKGVKVQMPDAPGAYRLFFYAYDDAGNVATANLPLLVKGEVVGPRLPVSVYEDSFENMPWSPSGWMGSTDSLTLDGDYREDKHDGFASIKMRYEGTFGWVGVAWQHPPNNWGDQDGGHELTGAKALEVWARGEYGGEKVSFGVGLLEEDRAHPDSAIAKIDGIQLTRDWQKYRVPLKRADLSSIKTGFVVTLTGRKTPVTIYLDSIRFVR